MSIHFRPYAVCQKFQVRTIVIIWLFFNLFNLILLKKNKKKEKCNLLVNSARCNDAWIYLKRNLLCEIRSWRTIVISVSINHRSAARNSIEIFPQYKGIISLEYICIFFFSSIVIKGIPRERQQHLISRFWMMKWNIYFNFTHSHTL